MWISEKHIKVFTQLEKNENNLKNNLKQLTVPREV